MGNEIYIPPHYKFYSDFKGFEESSGNPFYDPLGIRKKIQEQDIFDALLSKKRAIILADPGYGKTRLFEELKKRNEKKDLTIFIIKLKSYQEPVDLLKFIENQISIENGTVFDFAKDTMQIRLCFDGLDEVDQNLFNYLIQQIHTFMVQFSKNIIYVACRSFFYRKFPVFRENDIPYFYLERFDYQQIHDYLSSFKRQTGQREFSEEHINDIIDDFRTPDDEAIIRIPRYLEKYAHYSLKFNPQKPSKSELFDYFINERLALEDSRKGFQDCALIRHLLEKIALIMEIYQKNELSKNELVTLLDELNSNIAINFLSSDKLKILFDRSLLVDNGKSISFEDRSLQEYLASCEMLRLGGQRVIFEIAVEQIVNEIHPSWFETLMFAVDQNMDLLEPLIEFGMNHYGIHDRVIESKEYLRFLINTNTSKLSKDQKIRIFKRVFGQYQAELIWIDREIDEKLADFYDDSQEEYLKSFIDVTHDDNKSVRLSNENIRQGNIACIIDHLLNKNKLNERAKDYWRDKLIQFANDKNENGVLQRNALFALAGFQDNSIIDQVSGAFNHRDSAVRESFIVFCRTTDSNHVQSVSYFIKGMKQNLFQAYHSLNSINEPQAILMVLDALIEDPSFLMAFSRKDSFYSEEGKGFFRHIKVCYDNAMGQKLLEILFLMLKNPWSAKSLEDTILELLEVNDTQIFDNICRQIANANSFPGLFLDFKDFLAKTITMKNISVFAGYFKNYDGPIHFLHAIFREVREIRGDEGILIYEEGRKYFKSLFDAAEQTAHNNIEEQVSKEELIYNEFQVRLEPSKGRYATDLFSFFLNNYKQLEHFLQKKDIDRITKLTIDILTKFDPEDFHIKILEHDRMKGNRKFRLSSDIFIFENCIEVAHRLSILISPEMRNNIINFIPFAHSCLETILKMIDNIRSSELRFILDVYHSDNDIRYFRPDNLIDLAKHDNFNGLLTIIKGFVDDDRIDVLLREKALRTCEEVQPDREYLNEIVRKYKKTCKTLQIIANELLITHHIDDEAIKWRIKKIKDRKFKFTYPKCGHEVGAREEELDDKRFAYPIMKITSPLYFDEFLDLLRFSLSIIRDNKNYWNYAQYIWHIVVKYVDNLKYNGNYKPIQRLEKFISENSEEEGINWFRSKFKALKRGYLVYLGKPKSIIACIKKYNELKDHQYDDIATPRELHEKVIELLEEKLRLWIEIEGARKQFYDSNKKAFSEPRIQRLIYTKLQDELKLIGVRAILREPQKLDDERVDFLVSYGLSPNIIEGIEIKKSDHKDLGGSSKLTNKESFLKLKKYMEGYHCDNGILLIFNIHCDAPEWSALLKKVNEAYSCIENVTVIGINARN
ncbi:MAG: NACHT domain-containing NTPase [Vulcanimicrobiota bacterium]